KLVERVGENGWIKVGDQKVAIGDAQKYLNNLPQPDKLGTVHDWMMTYGNETRSAQAVGSQPLLEKVLFKRALANDECDEGRGKEGEQMVKQALQQMSQVPNTPLISGIFPIALDDVVIYRSYHDVRAVYLKDLKDVDGKVIAKAGELAWKTIDLDGGLAT